MDVFDLSGGIGAALILFGLYRTSRGLWNDRSLWLELDHLVGSALLIIYLAHSKAYIGIVINVAYFIAAVIGLRSYAEKHRRHKKKRR